MFYVTLILLHWVYGSFYLFVYLKSTTAINNLVHYTGLSSYLKGMGESMLLFFFHVELKLEVCFSLQILTTKKNDLVAQSAEIVDHHNDSVATPAEFSTD